MEKENKSIGEKLNKLADFIKNTKTMVITLVTLTVFAVAIISGDEKNIVQNLYEKLTGEKYRSFSQVTDRSNTAYLVLKAKLSRDNNIELPDSAVSIFKESDTLHRFRVTHQEQIWFYRVKKKPDGTWLINQE